jgi:hypothetical protein
MKMAIERRQQPEESPQVAVKRPEPIVTTHNKPSHWLTPSQDCRDSEDDRAIVLTAYWATVVMTLMQSGRVCVTEASSLFLRSATPSMAADWGDGAGWSNGPSLG